MIEIARRLLRYRALLVTLTSRELKARYRGSALGFFWSLAQPLLLLLVYSLVFGYIFAPRVGGIEPYPLFLIASLFPWTWFSTALIEGTVSLVVQSMLLRRSVFPVELLPVVPVLANLVQLLFALPVLVAGLLIGRLAGYPVGGWGTLAVPLVILLELPMIAGFALALAALHAHFKDVRDLLNSLLTLLFFLTPVLYPIESIALPALRWVVKILPATPFTLAYHEAVFYGRFPSLSLWIQMALVSLVGWAVGCFVFGRLRDTLVEAV